MAGLIAACPAGAPEARRRVVPDNLFKELRASAELAATTEYSANGSFPDHNHAAVSACIFTRSEAPVVRAEPGQKNIWISLTAD